MLLIRCRASALAITPEISTDNSKPVFKQSCYIPPHKMGFRKSVEEEKRRAFAFFFQENSCLPCVYFNSIVLIHYLIKTSFMPETVLPFLFEPLLYTIHDPSLREELLQLPMPGPHSPWGDAADQHQIFLKQIQDSLHLNDN
jgi:hypothetical protein